MMINGSHVSFLGTDYPEIVRCHQGLRALTREAFDWLDTNYFAEVSFIDEVDRWDVHLDFISETGADAFVKKWGKP